MRALRFQFFVLGLFFFFLAPANGANARSHEEDASNWGYPSSRRRPEAGKPVAEARARGLASGRVYTLFKPARAAKASCGGGPTPMITGQMSAGRYKDLDRDINCKSRMPQATQYRTLSRVPTGLCCTFDGTWDGRGGYLKRAQRFFGKDTKSDNVDCWANKNGGSCKSPQHQSCENNHGRWFTWLKGPNGDILTDTDMIDSFAYGKMSVTEDGNRVWVPTDYRNMLGDKWLATEEPSCPARTLSPLIIDFGNSQVALSNRKDGVDFDLAANGNKQRISWPTSPQSMFLVFDKGGAGYKGGPNGTIDDGNELFGNLTKGPDGKFAANGFLALAKYDANHDGKIDGADPVFDQLRLWSDKNRNGISEGDELITLNQGGVRSLSLAYVRLGKVDEFGNAKVEVGSITLTNGQTRKIYDVWFEWGTDVVEDYDIPVTMTLSERIRQVKDVLRNGVRFFTTGAVNLFERSLAHSGFLRHT